MITSTSSLGLAAIFTLLLVNQQIIVKGQYAGRNYIKPGPQRVPIVVRGDQPPPPDTDSILDSTEDTVQRHPLTPVQWHTSRRRGYTPVKLHPCEQSSCYPATGNLLIGREEQLTASSTCGLYGQQRYCIVSHLEDPKKCFWCDSRPHTANNPTKNHLVSNIVYRMFPGTRQKSWWQSENGKENVTIQLNLEAEFHFTHLIMVFKTFRPAAMFIERSYDFGKTWQVYRYFAHKCAESFPGVPERNPENLTDVVCEYRYSSVEPSTAGEVIFRVLPPTVHIDNPYSQEVQNLLKMTNLRINFTKLHTLGDDLLDRREEIQEKYYYSISDMVVRGSCSCYGHANRCLPLPDINPKPDMVHGRCECTHNTKGRNCEECEDFFNDLPWRPAIGKQTNACKRCNCNNHATSCHFDAAVYELNGRVSGGVCDGCKHNTIGANCEQCKPYFYRDPTRDIQDPELCRPCDCDPLGALDGGICDSLTDSSNNLEAGSCHCKENVDGRRCDTCKNGYWNFTADNPQGCQSCTCNTLGTIDNQGCNVDTGECTCKRYVTGRDCNQCLPEYFGLSEQRDGCKPCDCDPGGSLDNNCDVITGQCRCREHLQGRTCNLPIQQHFTAPLDYLLYEAELARGSSNCQVFIREPFRDGRENTWTGIGFMKGFEGSTVEFTIDDIKMPMEYEIVLRYEPLLPGQWDDVAITVIRPDAIDPEGPCRETRPEDDYKTVSLPDHSRSASVFPPVCLEPHKTYKMRIDFKHYNRQGDTPTAAVLLDSIVLIPRIESLPIFHGSAPAESRRQEYNRYQCGQAFYTIDQSQVPDICKKYHNSIGYYVFDGAFSCQCNPTGSVSKLCSEYGGSCTCKPNVVGRRCDRCAPGTYGFGPEGCKTCDCNSIGSLDNFCDAQTGQCKCRLNTYGRECDECRLGFWNFPNCQRCECNGHADKCEPRTGTCISCRDNTQGHGCDTCIDGHYGDPRLEYDIPCRQCPCPGVAGSGHSYADRCYLDPQSQDVVCECQQGYSGWRCDVCDDNYFGNPEIPGGSCQPCDCSNKIDIIRPGNCDPHSGECKQCLENTEGFRCENCQDGFFRIDPEDTCIECVCNILGSNTTAGKCDKGSGQCICHPNVIGRECDKCVENHWKIASGSGCEFCACDPVGSTSQQCDEYYGNCDCKPGFGGRQCDQCKENHWGNPKESKCYPCECNEQGSASAQCNQRTGDCVCKAGIGGPRCDTCAKGFLGSAPYCSPCGECFDNWNRTLNEHRERTLAEIERAKNMKKVGATGAYTKEFDEMQKKLEDIEQLLNSTSISPQDLDSIDNQLKELRDQLNKINAGPLKELDNLFNNATSSIKVAEYQLVEIYSGKEKLDNATLELEANATLLQEANVEGALNLIQLAKERATKAAHEAERTQETLNHADRQCKATENLLSGTRKYYEETQQNNDKALVELNSDLQDLQSEIPNLNELVCDKRGDPCDSVCGGAGCGTCGDLVACDQGAKKQSETAYLLANNTEMELRDKEDKANELIRNVSSMDTANAKALSEQAFNKSQAALDNSKSTIAARDNITKQLREFLYQNKSTPSEVGELAKEILQKKIKLEPEQIKNLADKIADVVKSLTNIDDIIDATKSDLEKVNDLKIRANDAKENAAGIFEKTEKVEDQLKKTNNSQDKARDTLNSAWNSFPSIKDNHQRISAVISDAQNQSSNTTAEVKNLLQSLKDLQEKVVANNVQANLVRTKAEEVEKDAESTREKAKKLTSEYKIVNEKLADRLKVSEETHDRAAALLDRASRLIVDTDQKKSSLSNSQKPPETLLEDLEKEMNGLIEEMDRYISKISEKNQYYNQCAE